MMKRLFLYLPLLLIALGSASTFVYAQDVSVQASVSETTIGTEEAVTYRIQIEGVTANEVSPPRAPEASGLSLIRSNPSTQQSVSIVNGRMTQSMSTRIGSDQ